MVFKEGAGLGLIFVGSIVRVGVGSFDKETGIAVVGLNVGFGVGSFDEVDAAVVGFNVGVGVGFSNAAVVGFIVGVGVGSLLSRVLGTSREICSDTEELLAEEIADGFCVGTDAVIVVGTRAGFFVEAVVGCSVPVGESEGAAVGRVLGLIVLLGYEEGTKVILEVEEGTPD